jgi:hypothetical protein
MGGVRCQRPLPRWTTFSPGSHQSLSYPSELEGRDFSGRYGVTSGNQRQELPDACPGHWSPSMKHRTPYGSPWTGPLAGTSPWSLIDACQLTDPLLPLRPPHPGRAERSGVPYRGGVSGHSYVRSSTAPLGESHGAREHSPFPAGSPTVLPAERTLTSRYESV